MVSDPVLFSIFLIFTGGAILATVALFARQALIVAYIAVGIALGPYGFGLIENPDTIKDISDVGIIFLLFLLGLDLQPQELWNMLRKATLVTVVSSIAFAAVGVAIARVFGFALGESLVVGATLMFSSTIIGLKLLPTTVLHHQHTGEIIISILLLQDLIAIIVLLAVQSMGSGVMAWGELAQVGLSLPGLVIFAALVDRYVLVPLIARFDTIQEYIFLMAIGWCLGMAELAGVLGLSHEIGAFIGGVVLATSPIALFIAESLRPLRDFFLVMFFFSLGAGFNLGVLEAVWLPAVVLALAALVMKPLLFRTLLRHVGEAGGRSLEVGVRLGQISEFSLLIAVTALGVGVIGDTASYVIQLATLLTFVVSSYLVVLRYPTPIALSDRLRRN
ncbi:MAG: cation:proton antiporter [Gammaproteobacteria bacterium]